jgi:hypothetical protein
MIREHPILRLSAQPYSACTLPVEQLGDAILHNQHYVCRVGRTARHCGLSGAIRLW